MLDEMDAGQLAEWDAMDRIDAEDRQRAELAAKAQANVQTYQRRR